MVDRQALDELVPNAALDQRGLRVLIGDDNPSDHLRDCSLVVAPYGYEYGRAGYVAIIGPDADELLALGSPPRAFTARCCRK